MLSSKKAKDIVMIDIAEKSSFADYFVISMQREGGNSIEEALDKESVVKDYRIEEFIYANSTDVLHDTADALACAG